MERKNIVRKGLIVATILLFISVNVIPSISGNINESRNIEIFDDALHSPLQVTFTRPENGIYCFDKKILPFFVPLILCGKITIEAEIEPMSEVERIELYINDGLFETIVGPGPYDLTWVLGGLPFSKIKLGIIAYDYYGNQASDEITIWFLFG